MRGMRTRLHESRPVVGGNRRLAIRSASAIVLATVSSRSDSLITSTSFITGTGLKKCMPTTRSAASLVAVAIEVIEMSWCWWRGPPRREHLAHGLEEPRLHLGILGGRLDRPSGRSSVLLDSQ